MDKQMDEENVQNSALICYQVVDQYKELLNSFVSDFYIESHWNLKLSNDWKTFLENITFSQLGDLLNYDEKSFSCVNPLTFLCLQEILRSFSVRRKLLKVPDTTKQDKCFNNFFWKNVKLKKRHEIEIISKICYQKALRTNCFNIVDIGSGLGHLSRLLAFQYGFNVCTFEANNDLTKLAQELDSQFENVLLAKNISYKCKRKPIHINKRIEQTLPVKDFELLVRKALNNFDDNFKFGLVGLHPCGNLGSTLLHLYSECAHGTFINMVSCCYMKLSFDPEPNCGFPLSIFCKKSNYTLDYLACETACHAIENYVGKIKINEHYYLKIHSFRAALEHLLVKTNKNLKHCAVGNVKYEDGMTFKDYCAKATKMHDLVFSNSDIDYYEDLVEETWTSVVKFYSVRLLFAPLVESIVLYDRLLYLIENKSNCEILPVFDCKISPRNHVISAEKIRIFIKDPKKAKIVPVHKKLDPHVKLLAIK